MVTTDWNAIVERLKDNENKYACLSEWVDDKMADTDSIKDPHDFIRQYNRAMENYSQTVLALAEAERMAEPSRDPFLNYCPTCACRLPRPDEFKDFVCPESGGDPIIPNIASQWVPRSDQPTSVTTTTDKPAAPADEPCEVCPKCGGQWADYAVTDSPIVIGDEKWITKCYKCGTRKDGE